MTCVELDERARAVAAALQAAGLAGERALLLYPPGLEFIVAFLGCLYAGTVAVPAYPPKRRRDDPRWSAIVRDCRPAAILTERAAAERIPSAASCVVDGVRRIVTDEVELSSAAAWQEPRLSRESPAFLQYTSGSTGSPKGVVVTHGNLLHNEEAIGRAFRQSEESVVVGWLPLYHDMGLIGNVLQPLYQGARCILMSPAAFLQRPARWLRAVSRYRATTSGGPNFAYDLCVRRISEEDRRCLDLTSWQVAYNGSEPVRAETLERFAAAFAGTGFRYESFYPCYGLAESTLFVTGGETAAEPVTETFDKDALGRGEALPGAPGGRMLVGCGQSRKGHQVAIVDPETQRRSAAGRVGEVWVAGPSVADGYWGRDEATERTFRARLADDPAAGPWLATGDLGFLRGGELFIAGRSKDLVILRGRNLYPQDLELTAERCHGGLRPGCGAAFSVDEGGEERLVLVLEARRRPRPEVVEVAEAVRRAVAEEHEVGVYDVVLVETGTVPKTSSGKIRRRACRDAYLAGKLEVLGRDLLEISATGLGEADGAAGDPREVLALPATERRPALQAYLERLLVALLGPRAAQIEPRRPLTSLGLDSLRALELGARLEEDLGCSPEPARLLEGATLAELADEVLDLLESRRRRDRITAAGETEGRHPVSRGQAALWFLHRLAPESSAYNIAVAARVRGPLDTAALSRAFERLSERHPALRTRFPDPGGEVVQEVLPAAARSFELTVEEAAGRDEAGLGERLSDEARRPFDLERGPLLRILVLTRPQAEVHFLAVTVHHIVSDFWSLAVLFGELDRTYAAEVAGHPAPLAPLELRYTDFVRSQEEMLAGAVGERLEAWWLGRLGGKSAALDLPYDRPRPPVPSFRGGARRTRLSRQAAGRVRERAETAGATPFMTLLAAFQVLLHRYTGQREVRVGSPSSGRTRPELAGLVGYFVQPLVLAADLAGDPAFAAFLAAGRRSVAEAFRHQDYPFELLVERLHPEREVGRSPLFQVMFSLLRTPPQHGMRGLEAFALGGTRAGESLALGGLDWEPVELEERSAPFELTLTAAFLEDGLGLEMRYSRDLFEATTVDRMLAHFENLLASAVRDPQRRLSSLALLSAAERAQLREWNETRVALPADSCLHERFEAVARRSPDAVAVEMCAQGAAARSRLTYGELDERAGRLARHLRGLGVGRQDLVAIAMDRSPQMVVAMLGILKAGAAYVPLDPTHPQERLTSLAQDAFRGHGILLECEGDVGRVGPVGRIRTVTVESACRGAGKARPACASDVDPESLAYVIYTSGSTGRPKGVRISHRSVVNFLDSMERRPGLGSGDVFLAVTTLAFDIAVLEIFLPLSVGARVVLASRDVAMDGRRLGSELARRGITAMQATPATWRLLVESGWPGKADLVMLAGGEALPAELARRLLDRGPRLWNMYGPTETTIWSAVREVGPGEDPVRVGGPIGNTRLHVAGRRLELLPPGVPGEVLIGGAGLANGYLHRPALTAERFVPDPFVAGETRGERLYRVGDLARRHGDGTLEFLGRIDHQVKVRGYRVELGEIETALVRCPEVGQAVAVVRHDGAEPRLVAYVTPAEGTAPAAGELRSLLRRSLPEYMIPAAWVVLDRWPLTPNGKIDRRALPAPRPEEPATPARRTGNPLERTLSELWCEVLEVDSVGLDDNFFDLGGHSLLVARLERRIAERLERHDLTVVDLFQHPTVRSLSRFLMQERGEPRQLAPSERIGVGSTTSRPERVSGEVAVVGMAGRFPGADDVEAFWENLAAGVESITFFAAEDPAADPAYVGARGVLSGAETFDAAFFGYTPREAEVMDPQHRLFLECAWEALENAGYDSARYPGRIGLFASAGMNTYLLHVGQETLVRAAGAYQAFIANDKDFVPTRASYKLDLRGPSVNVQTACSSSLVAVHLACRSLASGESEMALAGGVAVRLPQEQGYVYEAGGILSPDGHCRAFDAEARGTVLGNGVGVVVLKPLERALEDGDTVHAVVKGSAVNNDGSLKMGYTAPSVEGQAAVVGAALDAAGVAPESVSFVETHGTGTELGDPIEVAALTRVFGGSGRESSCALGAVKSAIGHLDTAAGVAGLVKTVLALRHGQIPPNVNFATPNPKIPFGDGIFHVPRTPEEWRSNGGPRRAGVSSFGIGGTNVHVVLEEAPPVPAASVSRRARLLVLSAKTRAALDAATRSLADHLRTEEADLADVAYTLQVGRRAFAHRRWLVAHEREAAATALESLDPGEVRTAALAKEAEAGSPVLFLLSGQGSQHVDMGRWLYDNEPVFQAEVDRGAAALERRLGLDLRQLLYPQDADNTSVEVLGETRITQPALFVIEHALASLWTAWGVRPAAMLGHSIGELVAATLAGVFSYEDAVGLVAARGRLMQEQPPGAMLAVSLAEDDVAPLLGEELSIAAVNSPTDVVVSGPSAAVAALAEQLTRGDGEVRCRTLRTSHAFHSAMMRPAVGPFVREVEKIRLEAPRIPFVSNVTGTWITDAEARDPRYWGRHLVEPVRFADGVAVLGREEGIFLEVGPGRALSTLAGRQSRGHAAIASLPHPRDNEDEETAVSRALGRLWQAGAPIDWERCYSGRAERRRRVPLPSYPFERRRFWLGPEKKAEDVASRGGLGKKADVGSWFYAPAWKQSYLAETGAAQSPGTWLVLAGREGLGTRLAARLALDCRVVTVVSGERFARLGPASFTVDPASRDDFARVLESLGEAPGNVVHTWTADAAPGSLGPESGLAGLLALVQALAGLAGTAPVRLGLVTSRAWKIEAADDAVPEAAMLAGFLAVAGQELPRLSCRAIDVGGESADLVEDLAAELVAPEAGGEVAWRDGRRWVRTFEPVRLPEKPVHSSPSPPPGAWLVTGGLGGVGLALARALAAAGTGARLVLVGRRGLPPRETWDRWLEDHGEDDPASRKIRGVRELEAAGSEVLTAVADVADREALERAVRAARDRFGPLYGVIHAAGVAGGGLVTTRSAEEAAAVLRPKVEGTRSLLAALAAEPPETVVLCSSINAVVGGFGQGDYAAANAYLDAVAASAPGGGPRIVSLGWDRWRGVGMAAGAGSHPLLGDLVVSSPGREVYRAVFAVESHWVLAEHRIAGRPTVPGTAYLEMARAAFAGRAENRILEIAEVVFLEPLAVTPGSRHVVLTDLDLAEGGRSAGFRVFSRDPAGESWQEHCRGRLAAVEEVPRPTFDAAEIVARCPVEITEADVAARSSRDFLVTGRRWRGIEQVRLGEGELVTTVVLAGDLVADLERYELHPALLDIAVGSVQLVRDGDFLPLTYERLRVYGPLPERLVSHITLRGAGTGDTLSCDAALVDENGVARLTVEGFSMKRIGSAALAALEATAPDTPAASAEPRPEDAVLEGTIEPAEAAEVLGRVLSARRPPPHLVISPRDLEAVRDAYRRFDPAAATAGLEELAAPPGIQERPDLGTAWVAPGAGLEQVVAETWRRYLGIDEIGAHDNFFELGGTSLLGVQVVGELKRRLGREIATVSLFEAPTIAALAKYLAPAAETGEAFAKTRSRVGKKKAALERRQPRRVSSRRGLAGQGARR